RRTGCSWTAIVIDALDFRCAERTERRSSVVRLSASVTITSSAWPRSTARATDIAERSTFDDHMQTGAECIGEPGSTLTDERFDPRLVRRNPYRQIAPALTEQRQQIALEQGHAAHVDERLRRISDRAKAALTFAA